MPFERHDYTHFLPDVPDFLHGPNGVNLAQNLFPMHQSWREARDIKQLAANTVAFASTGTYDRNQAGSILEVIEGIPTSLVGMYYHAGVSDSGAIATDLFHMTHAGVRTSVGRDAGYSGVRGFHFTQYGSSKILGASIEFPIQIFRGTPAPTGTITTGDAPGTTLTDSNALFITGVVQVQPGWVVTNSTDGSTATVVSVDLDTQLTTTALTGGGDDQYDVPDAYSIQANTFTDITYSGTNEPQFHYMGQVRSRILGAYAKDGNTYYPHRFWWSAANDETDWDPVTNGPGWAEVKNDAGLITGLSCFEEFAILFQQNAVHRLTFVGGSNGFQRQQIGSSSDGKDFFVEVAQHERDVYYYSREGFKVVRAGSKIEHLAAGQTDRFFVDGRKNYARDPEFAMKATVSQHWGTVLFFYLTYMRNDSQDPQKALACAVYNMNEDRWSTLDIETGTSEWTFPPGSGKTVPDTSLLDFIGLSSFNPPGSASTPLIPCDDVALILFTEKDLIPTGTCTNGQIPGTLLRDSNAAFSSGQAGVSVPVQVGWTVTNTTKGVTGVVTSIDSEIQLGMTGGLTGGVPWALNDAYTFAGEVGGNQGQARESWFVFDDDDETSNTLVGKFVGRVFEIPNGAMGILKGIRPIFRHTGTLAGAPVITFTVDYDATQHLNSARSGQWTSTDAAANVDDAGFVRKDLPIHGRYFKVTMTVGSIDSVTQIEEFVGIEMDMEVAGRAG